MTGKILSGAIKMEALLNGRKNEGVLRLPPQNVNNKFLAKVSVQNEPRQS
jgi:hypothetical protein